MMNYQNIYEKVNRDLDLLAPVVRRRYLLAIDECKDHGFSCEIFEGWRSPFRQAVLFKQSHDGTGRWVTGSLPWQSNHQYGLSLDLAFKDKGRWSWDSSFPWDRVATIFKECGFSWPKPKGEMAHFEVTGGLGLSDIQRITREQGVLALWAIIEELEKQPPA